MKKKLINEDKGQSLPDSSMAPSVAEQKIHNKKAVMFDIDNMAVEERN